MKPFTPRNVDGLQLSLSHILQKQCSTALDGDCWLWQHSAASDITLDAQAASAMCLPSYRTSTQLSCSDEQKPQISLPITCSKFSDTWMPIRGNCTSAAGQSAVVLPAGTHAGLLPVTRLRERCRSAYIDCSLGTPASSDQGYVPVANDNIHEGNMHCSTAGVPPHCLAKVTPWR